MREYISLSSFIFPGAVTGIRCSLHHDREKKSVVLFVMKEESVGFFLLSVL